MDQNLRTNIKKTAAKLFLKYGLSSVSIDDICNELRISKKTFYTHFSQKEELILSVLMEHNEKRLKKQDVRFKPCKTEGNAIDHIMEVSAFHSSRKNDQFVNFFYDLNKYYPDIHKNKYYPDIHKKIRQHNQEHIRESICQEIRRGIGENIFRSDFDIEVMSRFLAMQFFSAMDLSSKEFSKTLMKRGLDFIIDVCLRVLCNRQGLDYYEHLLSQKASENKAEEEPLKDEELDHIIDQMMDCGGWNQEND